MIVGYHRSEICRQDVSERARLQELRGRFIGEIGVYLFQSIEMLGKLLCQVLLCLSALTSASFGLIHVCLSVA